MNSGSRADWSCFAAMLFPDSVERFSLVWVLRLGVLSLGVWGVVFLLVQLRRLGKYYSYVGARFLHHSAYEREQDWCKLDTSFSPQRVLLLISQQPYISDCPVREDFKKVVACSGRRSSTRIKQQGVSDRKKRSRNIFSSSFWKSKIRFVQ